MAEAESRLVQARAQLAQLKAQLAASQRKIAQNEASLNRVNDILKKHNVVAPIGGLCHLPARPHRRNRGAWRPEFRGKHHHDDRGYVDRDGRSEGR